jgi:2-polyprenyl-3-methyl-5-hydroxy-6-metoxy-1,4-benzoquinol methylase
VVEPCPVCNSTLFRLAVSRQNIQTETSLRSRFIRERLPYSPEPGELKDLLDFMHNDYAEILECARCGILRREEPASKGAVEYENDLNDQAAMALTYPRYLEFFGKKRDALSGLLRPDAEILEIGSHLGAFLQIAEEWRWRPTGLDTGRDTVAFARGRGLTVHKSAVEDASLGPSRYDAVFIWNCFEQIPDPRTVLRLSRGTLKSDGLLVIRVPNAAAYLELRDRTLKSTFARRALAYNNLLAFPYLYGYSETTLDILLRQHGFVRVWSFDSELITMPFVEPSSRVRAEQEKLSRETAVWTIRARESHRGFWIEHVYRKLSEGDWRRMNQGRLAECKPEVMFLPRAA